MRNGILTLPVILAATAAGAVDLPVSAFGNEPFWTVEIAADGITLTRMGDKGTETWPSPEAEVTDGVTTFSIADGPVITLARKTCKDTMTGLPRPFTVAIDLGDETLAGCGGDPVVLLAGMPWRVVEVSGAAMPADLPLEGVLSFDTDGRISGRSFCNRFMGSYTLTGEGISFGETATTRMACPEPQASLEAAMLAAMTKVTTFDITDDGELHLGDGATRLLRLSKTDG